MKVKFTAQANVIRSSSLHVPIAITCVDIRDELVATSVVVRDLRFVIELLRLGTGRQ